MNRVRLKTDAELLADITREIRWDPRIDQAPIEVAIEDGVVTLSGNVENAARKLAAFDTTSRVQGVRGVINNIEVHTVHQPSRRRV